MNEKNDKDVVYRRFRFQQQKTGLWVHPKYI